MIIVRRVVFYAVLFALLCGVSAVLPPFSGEDLIMPLLWFASITGILTATSFPLLNKAEKLIAIDGLPARPKKRLMRRVKDLNDEVRHRWIAGFLSSVGLVLIASVFQLFQPSKLIILLTAAAFFLMFLAALFPIITVTTFFKLQTCHDVLQKKINDDKSRQQFLQHND